MDPAPELNAAASRLRRLDPDQLAASARDLLSLRDEDVVALRIPLDEGTVPSLLTVDRLDAAATTVTALGAHRSFAPCPIEGNGSPECAAAFITAFGGRAFRRPLSTEETAWLSGIYQGARAEFTFSESIDVLARVILESPQFLYVVEEGVAEADLPTGLLRLTPWELASRLSYFLWSTMPDDALLAAAAAGRLSDPAQLEAEVGAARDRLRAISAAGGVQLGPVLRLHSPAEIVSQALEAWSGYHTKAIASEDGDKIVIGDPNLLLFYQNRLVPFAEALATAETAAAARTIAAMGGGA